ncbi:GTPase-activating protein GYP7-like [Hibiscus syriacus]|uniref:GTPase-activating protein GYP7-like n=1 Tax=Hibiscus syriacus TaxID=106335 RepID=UPI001923487D|nr:GTPase-activating protein GYP7-like [Hibiscus syriacus]
MWGAPGEAADSYYKVRPECTDVPITRFKIKSSSHLDLILNFYVCKMVLSSVLGNELDVDCGFFLAKLLSARKWQAAFSPDGHLDIRKTLRRIQRGGIHPSIRGEVWELLLGCYDPESIFDERDQIREGNPLVQHARWKNECCEIFPVIGSGKYITAPVITDDGQLIQDPLVLSEINPGTDANNADMVNTLLPRCPFDKKVIQWLLTLHQIVLDVIRTDRTSVFYEKQENLSKLWDILSVYVWIDTDVGYGQGMSDLCSPMIILLEDEADAFWCFERLIRRLLTRYHSPLDPEKALMCAILSPFLLSGSCLSSKNSHGLRHYNDS